MLENKVTTTIYKQSNLVLPAAYFIKRNHI